VVGNNSSPMYQWDNYRWLYVKHVMGMTNGGVNNVRFYEQGKDRDASRGNECESNTMSVTIVFKNIVARWNPSRGGHSIEAYSFWECRCGWLGRGNNKGGIPPININDVR
jgi:hypothetical protein